MIVNYIPNYHKFINKIKEDHHIIGYARKSEGKEDNETRIHPLQDMVNRLRERNLADSIYVSFNRRLLKTYKSHILFNLLTKDILN